MAGARLARAAALAMALLLPGTTCVQAGGLRAMPTFSLTSESKILKRRLQTAPTPAPTDDDNGPCADIDDGASLKNCEDSEDKNNNEEMLTLGGIVIGLLLCAVCSNVIAKKRMVRTHDEAGELLKKVPKGPKAKATAKLTPQEARIEKKYGPQPTEEEKAAAAAMPPMRPPPQFQLGRGLQPLGSMAEEPKSPPAQKTIPFDVNKPFGWKRRQGNSLLLTKVTEGKQAHDLGVKVGWKIVSVDGVGVKTAEDFDNEIEDAKKSDHGSKEVEITFDMLPFRLPSLADPGGDVSEKLGKAGDTEEDEDSGRLRMFESPEKPKGKKEADAKADEKPATILKKPSLSEKLEKKDKEEAEKAEKDGGKGDEEKKAEAKEGGVAEKKDDDEGPSVDELVEMTGIQDASYRPAKVADLAEDK